MKLMAAQFLILARQQTIPLWPKGAIAHLEPAFAGMEGKQPCHRSGGPIESGQALPEQQHAATFGVDRLSPRGLA